MNKQKTNRAAMAATFNNLTREAIEAEREAWETLYEAYPDAVKGIDEFAFMYDICLRCVFAPSARKEPRRLANMICVSCLRANGNQALTLDWCWSEFDNSVDSGEVSADLFEGLDYLRRHAPASFAAIERLDALLPAVLSFPKCPRLLAPEALLRFTLAAVRENALTASRAA